MHIAEIEDFSETVLDNLKEKFEITTGPLEYDALNEVMRKKDAFWFRLGRKIESKDLQGDIKCKYIVCPATGLDHIDEKACESKGIQIISLRGEQEFLKEVRATSEHTLNLAMTIMRKTHLAINDVFKGNWERDKFRGFELYKKKVGIIGMGRLGKICAEMFSSLGCEICYYDVAVTDPAFEKVEELNELADKCEVISVHVNYNENTHHLLEGNFFSNMKNAFFINTSRGGIVDESALLRALENGNVRGAALDVLQGEPDIQKNDLVAFARINPHRLLLTPHIGGNTYESFEKTESFVANKLISQFMINE